MKYKFEFDNIVGRHLSCDTNVSYNNFCSRTKYGVTQKHIIRIVDRRTREGSMLYDAIPNEKLNKDPSYTELDLEKCNNFFF